jgi:RIP metalloprotease RseP
VTDLIRSEGELDQPVASSDASMTIAPSPPPPIATTDVVAPPDDQPDAQRAWLRLAALVGAFVALGVFFGLNVIFVILAVVVSILLHETGHYLAAKRSGMKVSEFFIGFGPRIWSFKRGETEYGVKPIWFGAYVKIVGMNNLEEVPAADEARTFRRQSYPKRAITAFAGPAMNLILAFVILVGMAAFHGYPQEGDWPRIDPVPGGSAARAGLEPGDRLISFAGEPMPGDLTGFRAVIASNGGHPVPVEYERDGVVRTTTVDLGNQVLGISGSEWPAINVQPDSAASDFANLGQGDVVVSLDDAPAPATFDGFLDAIAGAQGATLDLVVERDGTKYATALPVPDGVRPTGFFGVAEFQPAPEPVGVVRAVPAAGHQFGQVSWAALQGLAAFFSPSGLSGFTDDVVSTPPSGEESAPPPALETSDVPSGLPPLPQPAGIALQQDDRVHSILGIITIGSQLDMVGVIYLVAVLNIFLALFNLIPLLPFDGGHIAVATYERIREGLARRRWVDAKLQAGRYLADFSKLIPVTYAVVALILVIGLGALWLDAIDPPSIPN